MKLEIHIGCALAAALVVAVFAQECRGAVPLNQYIDYIQTDGGQKVVLDYIPNSNTVVEAKVDVSSTSKNHCIFCARGSSNTANTYTLFMLTSGSGGWRFCFSLW